VAFGMGSFSGALGGCEVDFERLDDAGEVV